MFKSSISGKEPGLPLSLCCLQEGILCLALVARLLLSIPSGRQRDVQKRSCPWLVCGKVSMVCWGLMGLSQCQSRFPFPMALWAPHGDPAALGALAALGKAHGRFWFSECPLLWRLLPLGLQIRSPCCRLQTLFIFLTSLLFH